MDRLSKVEVPPKGLCKFDFFDLFFFLFFLTLTNKLTVDLNELRSGLIL